MSTQDYNQPNVAEPFAAANGSAFTLVVNAAAIVDAVISNSVNAHSNNSNAPSATITTQPSAETADTSTTASKSVWKR